jgi:Na+/melibiose symporter-like transporter
MSGKKFSFKRLVGDIGGSAVQTAATGLASGILIPDPTGMSLLTAIGIGAIVGVVGGAVGSLWGVMTDDPYRETSMGSAALFSSVVGLAISTMLLFAVVLLGAGRVDSMRALIVISFLSSALSTSVGFLMDDLNAKKERNARSESATI